MLKRLTEEQVLTFMPILISIIGCSFRDLKITGVP